MGSLQRLTALQGDRPAVALILDQNFGAEGPQHPLGVVAALFRLGHGRHALGVQPRQQDGRLDLGRGHRLHIIDARQRAPGQGHRHPVLGRQPAEPRAHVG